MKGSTLVFSLASSIIGFFFSCNRNSIGKTENNTIAKQNLRQISSKDSTLFHFWDNFAIQDTTAVKNPDQGEQHLADFIGLLAKTTDSATRDQAVANMLNKAKANKTSFHHFIKLYEHYLYDGNSPMRNDLNYESVLRYLQKSNVLTDLEKEAYRPTYLLLLRNKVGQKAEDFAFELPDGKTQKLSEIESKYTLLLFYDPDCSHCKETIHQLRDTPQLVQAFAQWGIQVVAIDPWGDRNKWKNYSSELSYQWINGFDSKSKVMSLNLYDLKASPTLYLLDESKKVILKDASLQQVIEYFTLPK